MAAVAVRPSPVRTLDLDSGVHIDIFREGDGKTFPTSFVEAHLVGRLPSGCVFESTAGKGQPPMRMELGRGAILPGMELGLRALSLDSIAEVRIPPQLGYGAHGVPRMVPPNTALHFELEVVTVDGKRSGGSAGPGPSGSSSAASRALGQARKPHVVQSAGGEAASAEAGEAVGSPQAPWWVVRVERPPPSAYYLTFCQYVRSGSFPPLLAAARQLARRSCREVEGWDLGGSALVVRGIQDNWRAKADWSLGWFREHLGHVRQLVKWQGPVFTRQESLWDSPVWEASVKDYVDYVEAIEQADPDCDEANAAECPRLYLNGWPCFKQIPWLREFIMNPNCIDDISGDLLAEGEELRELFLQGLTRGYEAPPMEDRHRQIDEEYWELTKVFLSPKGSLTRLHFDNGGAHGWLSQVRGRKLFVCFPPSDGPLLHHFEGDEGLKNGTWLDPLAPDVFEKWPDCRRATPHMAVVEEGETIFMPQGWWHYAVALDTSITVMRNFYTSLNKAELTRRKDDALATAIGQHVLRNQAKLRNQPPEVLKEIAAKTVAKMREGMAARGTGAWYHPHRGGPP